MQIFNRAKNKTILSAMIISYIILFLSPILLGIMGYVRMESILEKNINNFLETKVELLNNEMTQCMNAMNTAVSQISADDYLTKFSEGKLEPEYSSAKKFIANIDLNRNRINGVKYMGVYFKNRDVSRADFTKSDWQIWSTCLTGDRKYQGMVIDAMWRMICEMKSRLPFSDWYWTSKPDMRGFANRTVQGGLYLPMLKFS